jgi:peptide/nickel transport system substrate-binding protein
MEILKKLRWPLLFLVVAVIVIAALLWGQQADPVLQETPEPATGGAYQEAVVGSLKRLNPLLTYHNPVDDDPVSLMFSSLIRFDSKGLPQPDLAESWGISRDGEVYNFSLREDASWHDGTPVTSQDVLFTIELLRSEEFPSRADLKEFWKEIEVNAPADYLLQFRLPEPFAPFLDYLEFGILPVHLLGNMTPEEVVNAEYNLEPIGSGPFQFNRLLVEGEQIQGLSMQKFPDYYGDVPYLEEFVFKYYPDHEAAWEAYQEGDVQGIGHIPEELLPQALADPDLNLYTVRLPEMSLIFINLDNPEVPFFQELAVRKALLKGLNRQWMIDHILNGQAVIATGPVFPKTWAYFDGLEQKSYDPEQALEMLKEAGYTIPAEGGNIRTKVTEEEETIRLAFTLLYPDDEEHAAIAEVAQENWAKLGLEVNLEAVSYEELISTHLENRDYQAALVDINLSNTPDPDPYPFWHQTQTTGGQNYAIWNDQRASEYLEQARIIPDPVERTRLYRNFQVRFSDQVPALLLFYPMYTYGVSDDVNGVRIGPIFQPSDRLETVTDWYLYSELPGAQQTVEP